MTEIRSLTERITAAELHTLNYVACRARGLWVIEDYGQGTLNPELLRHLLDDRERLHEALFYARARFTALAVTMDGMTENEQRIVREGLIATDEAMDPIPMQAEIMMDRVKARNESSRGSK